MPVAAFDDRRLRRALARLAGLGVIPDAAATLDVSARKAEEALRKAVLDEVSGFTEFPQSPRSARTEGTLAQPCPRAQQVVRGRRRRRLRLRQRACAPPGRTALSARVQPARLPLRPARFCRAGSRGGRGGASRATGRRDRRHRRFRHRIHRRHQRRDDLGVCRADARPRRRRARSRRRALERPALRLRRVRRAHRATVSNRRATSSSASPIASSRARSANAGEMEQPERAQRIIASLDDLVAATHIKILAGARGAAVIAVMSASRRQSGWTAPQTNLAERLQSPLLQWGPSVLVGVSADQPSTSVDPQGAARGDGRARIRERRPARRAVLRPSRAQSARPRRRRILARSFAGVDGEAVRRQRQAPMALC